MRPRFTALSSITLLMAFTVAAEAVSVTNRDEREHKLTIIEGETRTDRTLKPEEVLPDICPKGCVIRLNDSDDDEYEVEGGDVVSIEEGFLYYDGPDDPAAGAPGAASPAAPPAALPKTAPSTPAQPPSAAPPVPTPSPPATKQ